MSTINDTTRIAELTEFDVNKNSGVGADIKRSSSFINMRHPRLTDAL